MKLASTPRANGAARLVEYGGAPWWEVTEIRRRVLLFSQRSGPQPFGRAAARDGYVALWIAASAAVCLAAIVAVLVSKGVTS